ncbi:MAG TPA: SDR family NAD(P)-dependent oxidoreductase [Stellaceae bacterium]|nr:SDR family NAD(P)-dependent oxidoreductase [Stellaceae bacterium]
MSEGSIAIVGASCRFPGGDGVDAFWQLLASGTDAVSEVDPERWSTRFYYHPNRGEPGKSYTWSAGLIAGIDLFEPSFFGISPREAAQMDPQQRLLLELVWHAIEDAGIPAAKLSGSSAGVYIGASSTDYSYLTLDDPASGDSYTMPGSTLSILANRISYVFDLRGPSLVVDTACSSSLVALHHACEALRAKRIPGAIVGGVNLLLAPYPFLGFCRASMLSRRGRCFAFDARADGYVRGEGGAVIILKPLEDALAAGDPIRAVILGSGVNSDGRTIGLSLPGEEAQASLLHAVYGRAGIAPDDLAFIEMHGTGTPVGDPIEAAAVGRSLGQSRREPLPIGSVKSNIGHLEPASGMAGLLKAALALDHGILPPTLHCETPNPSIAFDALNLRLVRDAEPIARAGAARYAGVNSFGFGGTNAHVVLAAPPRREAETERAPGMPPLVVSARSEASLRRLARSWRDALAEMPAERTAAAARAAARRRDHHPHRLVALGTDRAATMRALADSLDDASPPPGIVTGTALREGKLAFVFSGNGAQWPGMAREAWRRSASFRAAVEDVDGVLRPGLGWSLAERLADGVDRETLSRADVAQPLLFATQVGIVRTLAGLGVAAAAHLGHSVGEIAAAWAAGALSLGEAGRVVLARSRCQQRTQGSGRMAALALAGDAARALIEELQSPIELAALNASQSVTVSGSAGEIERFAEEAQRRGLVFRLLDLDFAFHSREMDPIRDELTASLAGLSCAAPRARLISSVTGDGIEAERLDPTHWWRNIRDPVRFAEAARRLIDEGHRIFLEIGPSPILGSYLNDALRVAGVEGRVLASLSRKERDDDPFPEIAARCHVAGHDLTAAPAFDGPADPRGLPLYPWERETFWLDKTVEAADSANPSFDHPLLGFRRTGPVPFWLNHLDTHVLPWIADHAIEGMPVLPAAAMLEIALAAARCRSPDAAVLEAVDVELRRPLPFDKGRMRELRMLVGSEDGDFELASRPRLSPEPLTVHAVGRVSSANDARPTLRLPSLAPNRRRLDAAMLYRLAEESGFHYGPQFRTVERVEIGGPEEAVAYLDPTPIDDALDRYLLHPALLDGALQALMALLADRRHELQGASFLPWRFGRVRVLAPFGRVPRCARLRLKRIGVRSFSSDFALFDETGEPVAELIDCWFRRIELARRGAVEKRGLRVDLVPLPLVEDGRGPDGVGEMLRRLIGACEPDQTRKEEALLLDATVAAAAQEALRRLVPTGSPFAIGELVDAGLLDPGSSGIVEYLLRLLERFGAATAVGPAWRLEPESDLPELSEVWRLLLAEAPDLVGELALVAGMVEDLPKTIAGGLKHSDAGLSPMAEHLVHASPASAAAIDFLCEALDRIAKLWPKGRMLRILEIGVGSGATARRVIDRLAQSGVEFCYFATDADLERAARLSFPVKPSAGAGASRWSERADALAGATFDIVLAINVCARLQLDATAFAKLYDLLAPGGSFLAVEPEPNPLWDVAFGQTAAWWQADAQADDASPLRSGETWRSIIEAAGFAFAETARVAAAPWPCAALWAGAQPRPQADAAAAAAQPVAVTLVGGGAFAAALANCLAGAGHRVCAAPHGNAVSAAPGDAAPAGKAPQSVLFLVETPDPSNDPAEAAAHQIAALARLAADAAAVDARLWVVTCDAQQSTAPDRADGVVGAALWGFARTLMNEMPRLALRLIDLAGSLELEARAAAVAAELVAVSAETEIVWTPHGRHIPRLRRGLPPRWAKPGDVLTLSSRDPGGLDALGWEAQVPRPAGSGEVEIEVRAAGLNFRDVMWAMGLLPEEALIDGFAGPTFGLECAGIVRSLGPGVEGLHLGDRVMALAPAALATRVVTRADAAALIPPETSFAAAATLPVAFVTVFYALGTQARLAQGEHVLIHAAAGGVGLAAIQYAKYRGAVVIATAGSEMKRAFLRLAGADYVLDSRDLGFADAVREITAGQGVDVVLNSLSGEAMEESLGVLKPFGRFLELGKRDFYLNRRIHLRPLRQNIAYFAIDIDQLPVRRPDLACALLSEVSAALSEGAIRPLAHRIFSFAELDGAFRLMQAAGHIGKIVLVPDENGAVRLASAPAFAARCGGTYLVTGGIDGFGFEAARWLVSRGAGSIALIGRRGSQTPGCAARVAELAAAGADIRVYRGDAADRRSLRSVLDQVRAGQPPICGIVHAAAVIADGLATELDSARIASILRPKLAGALLLDALTREDPIELFLLFSSATTLLGAPGQGVYVAANLALEGLARRRRADGRPATAIAWGPIEDAGYLAARPEVRDALARRLGAKRMPAAEALSGLSAMIESGLPVIGFAETSWTEAQRLLPILGSPLFCEMRAGGSSSPSGEPFAERLASLAPEEALALLKTVVSEDAGTILRLPADGIDPLRPLSEIGMDSLMAVELRLALETRLGIDLPLMSLAEGTSVASIAARLAATLSAGSRDGEVMAFVARHAAADLAALAQGGEAGKAKPEAAE